MRASLLATLISLTAALPAAAQEAPVAPPKLLSPNG